VNPYAFAAALEITPMRDRRKAAISLHTATAKRAAKLVEALNACQPQMLADLCRLQDVAMQANAGAAGSGQADDETPADS
jgi:hypothetical protein